ncbi:type II 3-dehydroquinate dehydratase [Roseateles amylovorans]|uniref:3-dehydroquinate dehydratase n=1 Tax=Roseateles amylovorans TaxID=2978473 RepID=A0ABY6AUR0_9BURK|nr:type II 3-dehydroquinate dehydratase [Roseateles amylovorans]UXH76104.1 3-dehydroquinate dehydratase [Roseateles amylovorans]
MSSISSDPSSRGTLLLMNGPNLGRLGRRRPEVYGTVTLADIQDQVTGVAQAHGWRVISVQSNHEGDLVDFLEQHRASAQALVINPGALMMNGWSLRDALEDLDFPWFEVHISNVWAREAFRHSSVISALASGVIAGLGVRCYEVAARELIEHHEHHAARTR